LTKDGGNTALIKKLKDIANMVMFRHTLFSLPMVYVSLIFASGGRPSLYDFFWVTMAHAGARNAANALNRLVDHKIDALNPRTADRHLPKGVVSRKETLAVVILGGILLTLSAFMLDPLCVKLLPLAIAVLGLYSYTKRFTWACHLVLGIASGAAPLGAWIAVTGKIDNTAPIILFGVSALWVAGFDIIYATLDVDFDRGHHLYSFPSVFGIERALKFAEMLHMLTVLLLLAVPLFVHVGLVYFAGVAVVTGLLIYEHALVSPVSLSNVKVASYNVNEVVGVTLLFFTVLDLFFR
jgi:4-hydroxybenzoate polyprenyltransferase